MFFLDEKVLSASPKISTWRKGEEIEKESIRTEFNDWKKCYEANGKRLIKGIVRADKFSHIAKGKNIEGISGEFAKLKTENEIIEFANEYGNLGLKLSLDFIEFAINELKMDIDPYGLKIEKAFENTTTEHSHFEPIDLWWYHIRKVRNILKLYRSLVRINQDIDSEIEDNILKIGQEFHHKKENQFMINWHDNNPTGLRVPESFLIDNDFSQVGKLVLRKSIVKYASSGIKISASDIIETEKNTLGFYVLEKKTTPYLITAIYYELWQLINADMKIEICKNENCQLPFIKKKRREHCSDACKQEAYRIRKAEK